MILLCCAHAVSFQTISGSHEILPLDCSDPSTTGKDIIKHIRIQLDTQDQISISHNGILLTSESKIQRDWIIDVELYERPTITWIGDEFAIRTAKNIKIIQAVGSNSREEYLGFVLYYESDGVCFHKKDSDAVGVITMNKTYEHLDHELQTLDVLVWCPGPDSEDEEGEESWEDEEIVISSESQKEAYFQYVSALEKMSSFQTIGCAHTVSFQTISGSHEILPLDCSDPNTTGKDIIKHIRTQLDTQDQISISHNGIPLTSESKIERDWIIDVELYERPTVTWIGDESGINTAKNIKIIEALGSNSQEEYFGLFLYY